MSQSFSFGVAGNSQFAEQLAAGFVSAGHALRFGVSLPPGRGPTGARPLHKFCQTHDVQYQEVVDLNTANFTDFMTSNGLGVDFLVVSWPCILSPTTLKLFPYGVVGSHPTPLPWGRGNHPLHWMIAMGISELTLSVFLLDEGIDTGGLLAQSKKALAQDSSISDAHAIMQEMAYPLARAVGLSLADLGYLRVSAQPSYTGSYWRRRTIHDITIDFRMSVNSIHRLVKSFLSPFPGAVIATQQGMLSVSHVRRDDYSFKNWRSYTIGSVLACSGRTLSVRVDDGVVTLTCFNDTSGFIREGDSIPPPSAVINQG